MTETNTKERCKQCDTYFDLVSIDGKQGGYIPEHPYARDHGRVNELVMEIPWPANQPRGVALRCAGSLKRSKEYAIRKRSDKDHRHNQIVASVIEDASIAYDAWMSGRRTEFKFDYLLELAIKEYRRKFDVRGPVSVVQTERCGGQDWRNFKKDVYCLFCGGLVIARLSATAPPDDLPRVKEHAMQCALLCLAGRKQMMPRGHKCLIDEDRAFTDDPQPNLRLG